MTRRYYTPDLVATHPIVSLTDEEAAHAIRVMRVSIGDPVELFDGQGNQAAAKILSVNRRQCVCETETPETINREPAVALELVTAFPKPERAKEMIERLTEIGVDRVQPLVFERTQRPPTDALMHKLERVVIEACKQSGRNRLMKIAPVVPFGKWISNERVSSQNGDACQLPSKSFVAMPGGEAFAKSIALDGSGGRFRWVIGPEGGLSDVELAACRDASMITVDLGKRILRIETAACLVAARFLWD